MRNVQWSKIIDCAVCMGRRRRRENFNNIMTFWHKSTVEEILRCTISVSSAGSVCGLHIKKLLFLIHTKATDYQLRVLKTLFPPSSAIVNTRWSNFSCFAHFTFFFVLIRKKTQGKSIKREAKSMHFLRLLINILSNFTAMPPGCF